MDKSFPELEVLVKYAILLPAINVASCSPWQQAPPVHCSPGRLKCCFCVCQGIFGIKQSCFLETFHLISCDSKGVWCLGFRVYSGFGRCHTAWSQDGPVEHFSLMRLCVQLQGSRFECQHRGQAADQCDMYESWDSSQANNWHSPYECLLDLL